ncbi:MAG: hypothetical protein L0Z62_20430, partial [Gemmataceae bacterium]|nr:hypothetical protein [Gemmataceae bacterium]
PLGPALQHPVAVRQVALAPDGRTALTAGDGLIQLWDARAGRPIGPGMGQIGRMAFSPDGKMFVTTAADGTAWLYSLPALEGEAESILLWAQVVTGLELTPQGVVQALDAEALEQRRARLRGMAGPPLP